MAEGLSRSEIHDSESDNYVGAHRVTESLPVETKTYRVDVIIEFEKPHDSEAEAEAWASRIKSNLERNISPSFPEGVKIDTTIWACVSDP